MSSRHRNGGNQKNHGVDLYWDDMEPLWRHTFCNELRKDMQTCQRNPHQAVIVVFLAF